MSKLAVIAIGGNALVTDKNHKTVDDQFHAASIAMNYVADIIEMGWDVVITHGNGPQVGYILRRSELALHELHPVPMDYAGADTQGAIGYMFQKALGNEFIKRDLERHVVTIVTQVRVNRTDPAFSNPTKPIGSFMTREVAEARATEHNWTVHEDSGRGWRRVVPSPMPVELIEMHTIHTLSQLGFVVITCGGGGIPVVEQKEGHLRGVEAVIDKDFSSGLLAHNLDADLFVISTDVKKVAINFGKPYQKWVDTIRLSEARQLYAEGHFATGSMAPKVWAMIKFIEAGGKRGLITDPQNLSRALRCETGTHFIPD